MSSSTDFLPYTTIQAKVMPLAVGICLILADINTSAQTKSFERADFFINTNECVTCHAFLRNFAIALENSDTLALYMDVSASFFGEDYLMSKGVDLKKFHQIHFEPLLERHKGYFESYIVLSNSESKDTVYIKEAYSISFVAEDSSSTETLNGPSVLNKSIDECQTKSNRLQLYSGQEGFYIHDILFNKTIYYTFKNNSLTSCLIDPFNPFFENTLSQKFLEVRGYDFALTDAMLPTMKLLSIDKQVVSSIGTGNQEFSSALIEVPYAFCPNSADTALAKIIILVDANQGICGIVDFGIQNQWNRLKLSELDSHTFLSFGFGYYGDTLYIPLMKISDNYKSGDSFIGVFSKDSLDSFRLQDKLPFFLGDSLSTNVASAIFLPNVILNAKAPEFYHLGRGKTFNFKIPFETDSSLPFKFHYVEEITSELFLLFYQVGNDIYLSHFESKFNLVTPIDTHHIPEDYFAVVIQGRLYFIKNGGPTLGYIKVGED